MTAEIALLNKSAVALAADSAVTIGRGFNTKIYNTVNKIFELSSVYPVGVMIYGRLDFMGLPLETIIKQYRSEGRGRHFDHVAGYRDDFLSYLLHQVPIDLGHEINNIKIVMAGFFETVGERVEERLLEDIRAHGKLRRGKLNGLVQGVIEEEIAALKSVPLVDGFKKATVPRKLSSAVDDAAAFALRANAPTQQTFAYARRYAGHCISRAVLSDYRTGIVFAGFGEKEWCPSLEAVEIDGVIDGRLKKISAKSVDITRGQIEADIIGFAQDDMVQSFLHGIDPSIRDYFAKLIGIVVKDTAARILSHIVSDKAKEISALTALAGDFEQMRDDFRLKADNYIDRVATDQIRAMIRAMPKQELSNLALSLIEITSLKRKVSPAQETVGGEVDVAVISRSEGFVWTKRKHYFPGELNPRFFARHFGKGQIGA